MLRFMPNLRRSLAHWRSILSTRTVQVDWHWQCWIIGIIAPHGGMVVWTLCIGPLNVQYWPLAPRHDDVPF